MTRTLEFKKFIRILLSKKILASVGILVCLAVSQFTFAESSLANPKRLKGTVVAETDKQPIIGASIIIKGTTVGAVSDIDGNFSLQVNEGDEIIVQFIGFKPYTFIYSNQTDMRISLQEDNTDLDEVVVVGYGVQKKKLVTGATVQVDGENLQKMNTTSPIGALQSQSPGINITQKSGQPGEGFKVTIRGLGTMHNSNPLYVIDGVAGADINALNPSDIESIDVLKDAASSAIYGSRAANGVILVTTKRGKAGKIQVSYDGFYGIQNPYRVPSLLNASQYLAVYNEGRFNDGVPLRDWERLIPGIYEDIKNGWQGTNWLKAMENSDAPTQNHAVNVVGGNKMSNFSLGFSYADEEGIYGKPVQSEYSRYTFRINSDHVLYEKDGLDIIKIGENVNYSYSTKSGIGIGNIYWNDVHNMIHGMPIMPVYNEDGEYWDRSNNQESGIEDHFSMAGNPIAGMVYTRGNNLSKNHKLNANAYLELQPAKGLIFKSSFGYKMSANSYRSYSPEFELSATSISTADGVTQNMGMGYAWTWDNTMVFGTSIGSHNVDFLLGQSMEKWGMGEEVKVSNTNSIFNDFEHAYLTNTPDYTAGETKWEGKPWGEGSLLSFFGRANYNYKETYMLTLIMRADASSNFARGNRWGYFPSVSAGWVLTNESMLDNDADVLDFLKLRASWGQNGNCNIDNFQYLATIAFDNKNSYSFGNSKDSQSTGAYADILPNEDVKWETSEQINIGADARFFGSRLGVAADYYKKSTVDWLLKAPILDSYGTNAPFINGGDVENTGYELALNWNDKIGDITYGLHFNISHNKNEVTRIANTEKIIHGKENVLFQNCSEMYRLQEGKPMGFFYGYKTDGVFQNNAEIDAANGVVLQNDPRPGDLRFVDTNKDGVINSDDKEMIGNPHPDYTMGFGFNVAYKGLDLSIAANGAFGHQIINYYSTHLTTNVFNTWHGEGSSNRYPRLSSGDHANWLEVSDIYIEDADFVKLQNITLGYDLNYLFKNLPFKQTRIFVTAKNLYTFTGYSGQDPEIGYGYDESWVSGIDLGFYPSPRTFLVGANIKF